jgi:hypothetical protein
MLDVDRRVLIGHAERDTTDHYTHEDFERMREGARACGRSGIRADTA